ncbi:hypothetical protein DFP73DRAFT_562349 [Morchella snyderi]|nr:hypothetical protein DFP73DRAFT_562349 [Morchella snyderi]
METKQLLRHLLRQASVLYDDVARIYITRYILQRFRVNLTADSWRRTKLLKEGRRGLSVLIRANAGDPKPLTKILKMSYGRTGRRKHELLEPILKQDPEFELEALIPDEPRSKPPAISAALRVLLSSQYGRKAVPQLPETNIWGRPLPIRRKVNMLHRHHSNLLAKVLPPLSEYQMERLERLVSGLENPKPPRRRVLTALPLPEGTKAHNMTPRFWKRAWKKILAQSSTLSLDGVKNRWIAKCSPLTEKPRVTVGKLEDFEGLTVEKSTQQKQRGAGNGKYERTGGEAVLCRSSCLL